MVEEFLFTMLPASVGAGTAIGLIGLSFATSMLTAIMGLGGGILMIAVLASTIPAAALIPVHGLIQLGSNAGRAVVYRSEVRYPILAWFAIGAVIGVAAGAGIVLRMPREILLAIVGLFILVSTWAPRMRHWRVPDRGFLLVGGAAAFATMLLGATGAFLAPFLSPERLGDRKATIATLAACMSLKHGLKVVAFVVIGFAYTPWVPLALTMIVSGVAGTLAGRAVILRLPERQFRLGFRLLLTVLAFRLLYQSLGG